MPPKSDTAAALYLSGDNCPVAPRIRFARTPFELLRGWIGTDVPAETAMRLRPCARVHTFGVRCPLDIAHCDPAGTVLRVTTLTPNRIGPRVPGTDHVWEIRSPGFRNRVCPGGVLSTMPPHEGEV